MRTTFVRRTVLTASAVSLALLATACGGSDKADAKGDAKPSASASAAAGKGKSNAELSSLILAQADLPDYVFKQATSAEVKIGIDTVSDKAECLPLAKAQVMTPVGMTSGTSRVKVIAKPKAADPNATAEEKLKAGMDALGGTVTSVTLASYDGKGAEEAFASFKGAGTACAAGFEAKATDGSASPDNSIKFSKVVPGAQVTAGDEALAYTFQGESDGEKISTELVVVRKGSSLVTFYAVSLAGTAEQPKAVVEAQQKKLG
ncbi:hypothetical protein [Streptomyces sp. NBC_00454]|uniref:hypothetical protein n=1 Tax=Streptomyces sp. NBC_00454 TaxID=2975747 RepID=UPI0030E13DA7